MLKGHNTSQGQLSKLTDTPRYLLHTLGFAEAASLAIYP